MFSRWKIILYTYLIGAFFAFGIAYNNHHSLLQKEIPNLNSSFYNANAVLIGYFTAVIWPVVLIGKLSIKVTEKL